MRKLSLLAALALVALATPARAQLSFSPVVGYDIEAEGPMVGLAFEIGAPLQGIPLTPSIRPLVEYIFFDDGTDLVDTSVIRANADLIGRFNANDTFLPYAKAGLTLEYISVSSDFAEGSDSETELSLNLGGGAEFNRVFVEGEYGLGGIEGFRIRAGYRF